MSHHTRGGMLLLPGVPASLSGTDGRIVLVVAGMFAISIPIAFVTQWAYLCWVASAVVIRWIRRGQRLTSRESPR
ncbi:MAG: hypothetical protein ACRDOK_17765 [Streptosporangiaceae bacterium]